MTPTKYFVSGMRHPVLKTAAMIIIAGVRYGFKH